MAQIRGVARKFRSQRSGDIWGRERRRRGGTGLFGPASADFREGSKVSLPHELGNFHQQRGFHPLKLKSHSAGDACVRRAANTAQRVSKEFRSMKKLILPTALAMALALGSVSAWAQMGQGQGGGQWGHGQPMTADQRLQMMTKQLNLTTDQQEKIKPLLESESQQMQTLRQDSSLSREDRMTKMQQIRQSTNDQI